MRNYQDQGTYNWKAQQYEENTMPSVTLPNQAMSMKEIMERFARGLPISGAKVPLYDEENDLPDIRTLDLAERQQLSQQYEMELSRLREGGRGKEPDSSNPPVPYGTAPVPEPVQAQVGPGA